MNAKDNLMAVMARATDMENNSIGPLNTVSRVLRLAAMAESDRGAKRTAELLDALQAWIEEEKVQALAKLVDQS